LSPRITLDFTPLDRQVAESLTLMRTIGTLSGFFGALAVLLATIGLYGYGVHGGAAPERDRRADRARRRTGR